VSIEDGNIDDICVYSDLRCEKTTLL